MNQSKDNIHAISSNIWNSFRKKNTKAQLAHFWELQKHHKRTHQEEERLQREEREKLQREERERREEKARRKMEEMERQQREEERRQRDEMERRQREEERRQREEAKNEKRQKRSQHWRAELPRSNLTRDEGPGPRRHQAQQHQQHQRTPNGKQKQQSPSIVGDRMRNFQTVPIIQWWLRSFVERFLCRLSNRSVCKDPTCMMVEARSILGDTQDWPAIRLSERSQETDVTRSR